MQLTDRSLSGQKRFLWALTACEKSQSAGPPRVSIGSFLAKISGLWHTDSIPESLGATDAGNSSIG